MFCSPQDNIFSKLPRVTTCSVSVVVSLTYFPLVVPTLGITKSSIVRSMKLLGGGLVRCVVCYFA